jgi:hypothetical protein
MQLDRPVYVSMPKLWIDSAHNIATEACLFPFSESGRQKKKLTKDEQTWIVDKGQTKKLGLPGERPHPAVLRY